MKVKRYDFPDTALINDKGYPTPAGRGYLAGIKDCSGRVSASIEPLAGGATLADVIAKVNELIAALETARLMHPEA